MGSPWEVVAPIVPVPVVAVVPIGIVATVDIDGAILAVPVVAVMILIPIGDELIGLNLRIEVIEVIGRGVIPKLSTFGNGGLDTGKDPEYNHPHGTDQQLR